MKVFGHQLDKLHWTLLAVAVITTGLWIQQTKLFPTKVDNTQYDFVFAKYEADSLIIAEQYDEALLAYAELDSLYPNKVNLPAVQARIERKKELALAASTPTPATATPRKSRPKKTNSESTPVPAVEVQSTPNTIEENPSKTVTKSVLKITNFDGVSIDYIGETLDGKAHGIGVAVFDKKGFYEGQWVNNRCNGTGTYYWQNGDTYTGHYLDGYRTGFGTYTFVTGEVYSGEWKNNLRHGTGTLRNKRGKIMFEGEWKDDAPVRKSKKKKK